MFDILPFLLDSLSKSFSNIYNSRFIEGCLYWLKIEQGSNLQSYVNWTPYHSKERNKKRIMEISKVLRHKVVVVSTHSIRAAIILSENQPCV